MQTQFFHIEYLIINSYPDHLASNITNTVKSHPTIRPEHMLFYVLFLGYIKAWKYNLYAMVAW